MNVDYSFVIPVYNSGDELIRCVNSILKDNIFNIEILIVDDGSTNAHTLDICNNLSKSNSNIFVYHKKNEGPYAARIFGYKKAKGRYVFTPDSDDYFSDSFLSSIHSVLVKNSFPDIVSFNIWDKNGNDLIELDSFKYPLEVLKDKESILDLFFASYANNQGLCRKCFNRNILTKIDDNVFYGKMFEDGLLSLKIMNSCNNALFLNNAFYIYDHSSSFSLTKQAQKFDMQNLVMLKRIISFIDRLDVSLLKIKNYKAEIVLLLINYIKNIMTTSKTRNEKKTLFKVLLTDDNFNSILNTTINQKLLKKQKIYLFVFKKRLFNLFLFILKIENARKI